MSDGPAFRWRWLAIALCALAGAAANVYRVAWWHPHGQGDTAPAYVGFCSPLEFRARDLLRFTPGYCRIEISGEPWRPLDVTIWMKASASGGRTVSVSADDEMLGTLTVSDEWRPYPLPIDSPSRPQTPLAVVLRVEQPPVIDPIAGPIVIAPEVGRVDVVPRFTFGALLMPTVLGALIGIAAVLLLPRFDHEDPATPRVIDRRRATIAFVALVIYFGLWTLVRPPYQTPDEVQHHMRATSVLRNPWIARPGAWDIDPRFTNPLAQFTPPALDKLFFDPTQRLSRADLRELKSVDWPAPGTRPPVEPYERAIASYPTLYYLALFGIAEPLSHALKLTPYDSTFAWRGVSAAGAALFWTLVFIALERLPATRERATTITALLVLNPMTGFMGSAINVDAVNIPLAVLASLLFWNTLTTGERQWWTLAALVATAWTKPSGLQLFGALLVASVALWALGSGVVTIARLKTGALTLARAALISWVGFYAWSPPRFLGGSPSQDTIGTYLAHRWTNAPETWVTYWGKLGWLEYNAAPLWYLLLLIVIIIAIVCVVWRPADANSGGHARAFAIFSAALLVAFVLETLAGEFVYLPLAGYVLQGRHLLPASLGLAALMMHRVRVVRVALIVLLVLLNLALVQASVDRYYNGQWKLAAYALPFTRAQVQAQAR